MPEVTSVATAAAAIKKVAETAAQDIYSGSASLARHAIDKLRVQFGVGFYRYTERTYSKCMSVKTILHRIDPIPIKTAYVEPTLKIKGVLIDGARFVEEFDRIKYVVVTGLGGSGKSFFLKHTFLDLCLNPFGRIPIFVELRELNEDPSGSLFSLIHRQWSSLLPSFTPEQFDYALRKGMFTVLLDALDEIDFRDRDRFSKEIIELTFKYPQCRFLVTSRPDDRFAGWNEFYHAEIQPLNDKQVCELLEKIDFDDVMKGKFLKEVQSRLLSTHRAFLSNPLLCTMMLMTYNEFEEIPSKMHIFYQRAFDTLFSRHDKMKPSFKRRFHSALAEDDFKKLFSSFCFVSYLDKKHAFDERSAKKYVEAAKKLDRVAVEPVISYAISPIPCPSC
jgi:predicted NACHT family NTPase